MDDLEGCPRTWNIFSNSRILHWCSDILSNFFVLVQGVGLVCVYVRVKNNIVHYVIHHTYDLPHLEFAH